MPHFAIKGGPLYAAFCHQESSTDTPFCPKFCKQKANLRDVAGQPKATCPMDRRVVAESGKWISGFHLVESEFHSMEGGLSGFHLTESGIHLAKSGFGRLLFDGYFSKINGGGRLGT